jgi:hypothetical protein
MIYRNPGPPGPKKERLDKRDRRLDERRPSDHRPPRQDDNGYNNGSSSSSYNNYSGGGGGGGSSSSYTPGTDSRAYNAPPPSMQPPAQDQRLEQAQKAQQILSMLAHTQQQPQQPPVAPLSYPPTQPASSSPVAMQQHSQYQSHMPTQPTITSPVPVQQQTTPHLLQQPFVQPVPPTEDQATQVQQLLGLLVSASSLYISMHFSSIFFFNRPKLPSNSINHHHLLCKPSN